MGQDDCSTTISELNDVGDTHFSFKIIASECNLKIEVDNTVILVKFGSVVQHSCAFL